MMGLEPVWSEGLLRWALMEIGFYATTRTVRR
jgi:hypothetical protein